MYRILVVDDEPRIRSGIAAKIEQSGSSFIVCGSEGNGVDALKWLESNYADICIADIRMPVMDGLELIGRLKQSNKRISCIIVSSYNDFTYAKQAIELNVSHYILKPIDRSELLQSLDQAAAALENRRMDEAYQILVQKLGHYGDILNRWCDYIWTGKSDKYPLLIVDTLNRMESWIEADYVLLDALSAAWIHMVAKEVKLPVSEYTVSPERELGLDSLLLPRERLRYYYRLRAVMRMETHMLEFLDRKQKEPAGENTKIISIVKSHIDRHFAEKLNVEELADLIPVSRSYLTVLFKQGTGQTIWNYVVGIRMKKAKIMLLDHNLKIYELANRVGYENSEHFSKLFKDYYGLTPKEYRRTMEMPVE